MPIDTRGAGALNPGRGRFAFRALALSVLVLAAIGVRPAAVRSATSNLTLVRMLDRAYATEFYGPGSTEAFAAAAVGDVTGDGNPEIVVGGMDGHVIVYASNGATLLDFDTGDGGVQASPALVDLDGNGVLDILAGNTQYPIAHIWGFTGAGHVLFHAAEAPPIEGIATHGFFGTPTVGDIDGDGAAEVVAGSWDHRIYAWRVDNGQLKPGFPRFLYDTIWSSPAVADIDGDGRQEIIVGGDMDNYAWAPYPWGGMLWVLRSDASDHPGYPKNIPGETIWSTPAVVDLDLDGDLEIVTGTGHFFNTPQGRLLHAFDARTGTPVPGWPVTADGSTGAAPAIADLTGDGRPEIVEVTQGGWVDVWQANGSFLWRACARAGWAPCDGVAPTHGSPAVADVDNDGRQDVVVGLEGKLWVFDGPTGAAKYQAPFTSGTYAPAATPTIAQVEGNTWIVLNTIEEISDPTIRGRGDKQRVFIWRTATPLGRADWPTFKQNRQRTGTILDTSPPTSSMTGLANSQSQTRFPVAWSGSDVGTGIARFQIDVKDGSGPWVRWVDGGGPGTAEFYGQPGRTYTFRARAFDRAGNVSGWSATTATTVATDATKVQPFRNAQIVGRDGTLSAIASPPSGGPSFGGDYVRGLAMRPDGSGYVLDSWGGVHPFGGAPAIGATGWWPGRDVTRGIALNPDGTSGYVLDHWGGLHPVGGAPYVPNGPYWYGRDVARAVVLLASSTRSQPAGYVLDSWGGVHAFGSAPVWRDGPYWQGRDVAETIALNPLGTGGWVLDSWGGVHPFGQAPRVSPSGYWPGWDIARGLTMFRGPSGQLWGYVASAWGSAHPVNGAPALAGSKWWPWSDFARGVAAVPW